ncbi:hypothetical protein [Streptacidiphilus sp. MAP5-52]|uniref:hypothetical protein n=1 Tax=Streptacidiphilus sp. MAP5-52 TaxID=3156267 RepID=UPI0035189C13
MSAFLGHAGMGVDVEGQLEPYPRRHDAIARPTLPESVRLTCRIVTFQRDGRDHKHVDLAEAVRDRLWAEVVPIDLEVRNGRDENQVWHELAVPADVVIVYCHAGFADDAYEVWTELLGSARGKLKGLINANAVVFATCRLARHVEGLAALMARPTPAVACEDFSRHGWSPDFLCHLLRALAASGRPDRWDDALEAARDAAVAQGLAERPRCNWESWKVLYLTPSRFS